MVNGYLIILISLVSALKDDLHSNHLTSSKQVESLICRHTTMRGNAINFLYKPDHVTLWCLGVVSVVYARVKDDHVQ